MATFPAYDTRENVSNPEFPLPLYQITHHLTREDGSFDRAAIMRAVWSEIAAVSGLQLAESLRRRWHAARFERDTNCDLTRRNRAHAAALSASRADAERLAACFEYDVERLRFEVDRWHYGNSTVRAVTLPRFEAALQIAREHALAIKQKKKAI